MYIIHLGSLDDGHIFLCSNQGMYYVRVYMWFIPTHSLAFTCTNTAIPPAVNKHMLSALISPVGVHAAAKIRHSINVAHIAPSSACRHPFYRSRRSVQSGKPEAQTETRSVLDFIIDESNRNSQHYLPPHLGRWMGITSLKKQQEPCHKGTLGLILIKCESVWGSMTSKKLSNCWFVKEAWHQGRSALSTEWERLKLRIYKT